MTRLSLFKAGWLLLMLSGAPCGWSAAQLPPSVLGNAHNPDGAQLSEKTDEAGLSVFKPRPSRSPAGLRYDVPRKSPESVGAWIGTFDLGFQTNDGTDTTAEFNEFTDWDRSLLLSFDLSRVSQDGRRYAALRTGALGEDDQYAHFEFGSFGSFYIDVVHSITPHLFSDDASLFFDGIGSGSLTLPGTLTPGANTTDEIDLALTLSGRGALAIERTLNGISVKSTPTEHTTLTLDYTAERRQGERPFGGSFLPQFYAAGGDGGMVETVEPIDYLTHNIALGYAGVIDQFWVNATYTGSWFKNDQDSLTWENPFINAANNPFVLERGRFALYPDNTSHNLKLDVARALPAGQFTTSVSWTRMTQDEDLLPPTINSGFPNPAVNLDDWNTVSALSRAESDAEVENLLIQTSLNLVLAPLWTLQGKLRYHDRDVQTDYTAFNPLTGQIGYIAVDGGYATRIFEPGLNRANFHYRSIPFDTTEKSMTASLDYRPWRKTTLGLELARDEVDHANREVSSTTEDRVSLRLSSRTLSRATINASLEFTSRDAGSYDANPYVRFFTSSLPGFSSPFGTEPPAFTLAEMRKFDVADRDVYKLKARVRFLVRDDLDLSLQLAHEETEYDAAYGLEEDESETISLDLNYQPSNKLTAYAYWSWTNNESTLRNLRNTGFSPDPTAGGATYPLVGAWGESAKEDGNAYGIGFNFVRARFELTSDLSVSESATATDFDFATPSALARPGTALLINGFDDIEHKNVEWVTELNWFVTNSTTLRFFHRLDIGRLDDWHFDGIQERMGNQLFLGTGVNDYEVNSMGVAVRHSF